MSVTNSDKLLTSITEFERDYIKGELIGKGSYGRVFKSYHVSLKAPPIAAKVVDIQTDEDLEEMEGEIRILRECFSPYIVGFR
jgi:serine/threonine protein kinase